VQIIIVGCGRRGACLAQALLQRGHAVTVVDGDHAAFEQLGATFAGRTVAGDGSDRGVLLQAGVQRADGLAALTASDEANTVAAQLARQVFQVPRVFARTSNWRKAGTCLQFGIRMVSAAWSATHIAELLSCSDLDVAPLLCDGDVDLLAVNVPPVLLGRAISPVASPSGMHVVAVRRQGRMLLPTDETTFQTNDIIYLAVMAACADQFKQLLAVA